jgi:transcriptional regulator with XRE-family HTH domain
VEVGALPWPPTSPGYFFGLYLKKNGDGNLCEKPDKLKDLVLGYRKYTEKTQKELAEELGVPRDIETALESGSYKHPTPRLMDGICELTGAFDQDVLVQIGRGYRLEDELGPDMKYFIRGLEKVRGIDSTELQALPASKYYKILGSVNMDDYEVIQAGHL